MEHTSKFAPQSSRWYYRIFNSTLHYIHSSEETRLQSAIIHQVALEAGRAEIEKGIDINYHEEYIDTPLHFACRKGDVRWVCMLLYYGADPNIPSQFGILPILEISTQISDPEREFLIDVLFPYTFDTSTRTRSLRILAEAMMEDSSLFCRITENVVDVDYEPEDVEFLFSCFKHVKPKHFQVFVDKFGHVVEALVQDGFLTKMVERSGDDSQMKQRKQCLDILVNSGIVKTLATVDTVYSQTFTLELGLGYTETTSLIAQYIKSFGRANLATEEEVAKTVLLMVSYGLPVTRLDLDAVYKRYSNCELFRLLLYMNIDNDQLFKNVSTAVLLYCNPKTDIKQCPIDPYSLPFLLDYYNDNGLKKLCLKRMYNYEDVLSRVESMPVVPTLVEFSRNVVREYLVQKYDIWTSKRLYMVLDSLPIDHFTRRIIALEHKLY